MVCLQLICQGNVYFAFLGVQNLFCVVGLLECKIYFAKLSVQNLFCQPIGVQNLFCIVGLLECRLKPLFAFILYLITKLKQIYIQYLNAITRKGVATAAWGLSFSILLAIFTFL